MISIEEKKTRYWDEMKSLKNESLKAGIMDAGIHEGGLETDSRGSMKRKRSVAEVAKRVSVGVKSNFYLESDEDYPYFFKVSGMPPRPFLTDGAEKFIKLKDALFRKVCWNNKDAKTKLREQLRYRIRSTMVRAYDNDNVSKKYYEEYKQGKDKRLYRTGQLSKSISVKWG